MTQSEVAPLPLCTQSLWHPQLPQHDMRHSQSPDPPLKSQLTVDQQGEPRSFSVVVAEEGRGREHSKQAADVTSALRCWYQLSYWPAASFSAPSCHRGLNLSPTKDSCPQLPVQGHSVSVALPCAVSFLTYIVSEVALFTSMVPSFLSCLSLRGRDPASAILSSCLELCPAHRGCSVIGGAH